MHLSRIPREPAGRGASLPLPAPAELPLIVDSAAPEASMAGRLDVLVGAIVELSPNPGPPEHR